MSRTLRFLHRPGAVVEITQRTIQGRYLLRPSQQVNALIVGCLARAQKKNPGAQLHAVAVMSNHLHCLASFDTVETMAGFMCHLKTNLSKEIGRIHDWPGSLWSGRYHSAPVSDEPAAQISRLQYLLKQGTKEGLVMSPLDWPGVHPAKPLLDGAPMRGKWIDRTQMYLARLKGKAIKETDFTSEEEVRLTPLPALQSRSLKSFKNEVATLIADIERETLLGHRQNGTAPAGVDSVLGHHPQERPRRVAQSPQPRFHAATQTVRDMLLNGYREFFIAYRRAAEKLADGRKSVEFPEGCFPPRLPFVAPASLSI